MPRVALIHDFLLDLRGAERVFAAICDAYPDGRRLHRRLRRGGDRGPVRRPLARGRPSCSGCARRRARSARCCRSTRPRSSRWTCAATTSSSPPRARGRTACSSIPAPCTSATATTRSATRGTSARRRSRARNPLTRAAAARAALALAPVGLDRRPARRRLRRQLRDHGRADPALLRARVDGPASARRARALRARPGGRALPRAGGADGAQAHRRRDPGLQRARAAARGRRRRAGVAAAAAARGADGAADGPALGRRGRRPAARARRRSWSPPRRSSGSPPSSRWPSGRPVIALRAGGVLETVTEGRTGRFYDDGDDPRALAAAVARVRPGRGRSGGLRGRGAALRRRALPGAAARDRRRDGARSASSPRATERPVGRPVTAQIVTERRRIHEDSLNLSHRWAQSA